MNPGVNYFYAVLTACTMTTATFLSGCGGGGGSAKSSSDAGDGASASTASAQLTPTSLLLGNNTSAGSLGKTGITSQNAALVADLSVGLSQLSRYIETDFTGTAAIERTNAVAQQFPVAPINVSSAEGTKACKDGGNVTVRRSSLTGTLQSQPQAGDRALFNLSQCKVASQDIGTLQFNGAVDEFLTEYTGDLAGGGAGHAGMGLVLNNLQIGAEFYPSLNRSFLTLLGEMAVSVDASADSFSVSASSNRLSVTATEGSAQFGATLLNFKSVISQKYATREFSLTDSFRIDLNSSADASVTGSYTVTTTKPFTGTAIGGAHWPPSAGELTIVASNGSKLTLTAMSGGVVRLTIDENADGADDSVQDVLWENLAD